MYAQSMMAGDFIPQQYNAYSYGYPQGYNTGYQNFASQENGINEKIPTYWENLPTGVQSNPSPSATVEYPANVVPRADTQFLQTPVSHSQIQVTLEQSHLWQQFHSAGTEMILTKSGRRMFPGCRIRLTGLKNQSKYCVMMSVERVDQHRYRFQNGEWVAAGLGEVEFPRRYFVHQDSPATGAKLMKGILSFHKVKLSNSNANSNYVNGKLIMHSMHRYQVCIHVVESEDHSNLETMKSFPFPITSFVTVTAYQNTELTKLKIENNPFAKGFREDGARGMKTPKMHSENEFRDEDLSEFSSAAKKSKFTIPHLTNVQQATSNSQLVIPQPQYGSQNFGFAPYQPYNETASAASNMAIGNGFHYNSYFPTSYHGRTPFSQEASSGHQTYPYYATEERLAVQEPLIEQVAQSLDVANDYQGYAADAAVQFLGGNNGLIQSSCWETVDLQATGYPNECVSEDTNEVLRKPYSDEGYSSPINDNLIQSI